MYTIISVRWANPSQTVVEAVTEEAGVVLYHPGRQEWPEVSSRPDIAPYAPPAVTPTQVKMEASRRILDRLPIWKQMNMNARSNELFRIQAGFMRANVNSFNPARALTAEETAEELALKDAWDWVKAVRAASDALEAMQPIPQDYATDAWWP